MSKKKIDCCPAHSIVVAGDVCLDILETPVEPRDRQDVTSENWRLNAGLRTFLLPGGAMLLSRLVASASRQKVAGPALRSPADLVGRGKGRPRLLPDAKLGRLSADDILESLLQLVREPIDPEKSRGGHAPEQWRVNRCQGFAGPDQANPRRLVCLPENPATAELVVLDDTGNGFRQDTTAWPATLGAEGHPGCIVLKLHRPLPASAATVDAFRANDLWTRARERAGERFVAVVDVNDLRLEGASISRGLSWEKTALEVLWHLRGDPRFAALRECPHLIVRLGLDGALCYHHRGYEKLPDVSLVYDPAGVEDGFREKRKAGMVGMGAAFTAWLSASLLEQGPALLSASAGNEMAQVEALNAAVRMGLAASRRIFQEGFGDGGTPSYPAADRFADLACEAGAFADIQVPVFAGAANPDPEGWTILDTLLPPGSKLEAVAEESLRSDESAILKRVPQGVFKKLRTCDRFEVEAYRSICAIMGEYLRNPAPKRPLSIAVFGPPGSGKSFGVQQVAEHIRGGVSLEVLPAFNLSQFHGPDDLINALHLVRDCCIRQHVPLVFFDEFDSELQKIPLGWLKYFLAPMQDGLFMDRGAMHPIGKAVFIFAGGTAARFDEFLVEPGKANSGDRLAYNDFRLAKGPDFVSRLRAWLDIIGIDHAGMPKAAPLLRRASVLRFMLKEKAPGAFSKDGVLQTDEGLSRALLQVPRFHHGVRSMEAILDMSRLSDCRRLGPSCLPPPGQMALHVNVDSFSRLVFAPATFEPDVLDRLARRIHKEFLKQLELNASLDPAKPTHKPWESLDEMTRESNRDQARMMPIRLRTIDLFLRKTPGGSVAHPASLTNEQVETLARDEHERWMAEKLRQGWVYGTPRDNARHIHPCILPWDDPRLSDADKEKDRQAMRQIPRLLAEAGYEIVP